MEKPLGYKGQTPKQSDVGAYKTILQVLLIFLKIRVKKSTKIIQNRRNRQV